MAECACRMAALRISSAFRHECTIFIVERRLAVRKRIIGTPAQSLAPTTAAPATPRRAFRCRPTASRAAPGRRHRDFRDVCVWPVRFRRAERWVRLPRPCSRLSHPAAQRCRRVAPSKRSAQRCAPVVGVDQLAGDAHAVAGLAHAAFEHIAHAEFAADLLHIDRLALVGEARIAGDDEEPAGCATAR